ncbi:MAG: CoA-binding protein [Desulfuromonas sp.]|uniref:CoA-binding protein n=1 Tax=Desulfuromonas sp. TaxID=892 RepID=UPI000CAC94E5|nr:CoA-binding protein [Desulfuromonas sp.]PLX84263.1 MAG: CoA-binding protein [Desulfuromonas sp.]
MTEKIAIFLAADAFGVAGASADRSKFGNKVLRCLLQCGRRAIPVNPTAESVEGIPCVASVSNLPEGVKSLSVVTPPKVTEVVVEQAIARGLENILMQPGAESPRAVEKCREKGINVIADGSCLLVALGFSEH